ncbi:MAG: hypothetical protein SFU25_00205, partial [Candidatus Caenarcaniphilales bacterium]|nr:hypothetical protein [Candidatus Caenarcaniphilales bacterium]
WGGFISWVSPKTKIFIDGRMPSWKINPEEGNSKKTTILEEFNWVIRGNKQALRILDKYKIQYLLYSKARKKLWIPDNWQKIYEDETSLVFARKFAIKKDGD